MGVLSILLLVGCGGGGSGSSGSSGSGSGGSQFPDQGGGETTKPPPSVQTARIVFASAAGEKCCVAVDAALIPGGALLVLDDLPGGPGTVTVAFYPGDFAPAVAGITLTCATAPADIGSACDTMQVASPSFESDPQPVNIVPGGQTDLADLVINATPFVLTFQPPSGQTAADPVEFAFTMVDAVTGIEADSVALEITVQIPDGPIFRPLTKRLPLMLSACNDTTSATCSPNGSLALVGFHASTPPMTLVSGPVDVRILGVNQGEPSRDVDFRYDFQVAP